MRHIDSHNIDECKTSRGTAVMLGNFDGMHMGHRVLFDIVTQVADASGLKKVVLSFRPHPMLYFGVPGFGLLTSGWEKKRILERMGADVFIEYPFDETLRNMSPEEFVKTVIVDGLRAKVVVVGDDYTFGRNRGGNPALLRHLGKRHGFRIHEVDAVTYDGERVCSSLLRKCVSGGNMVRCAKLMTRPYQILGVVEHGKKLGRRLGFPTINISPPGNKVLPPNGVYLTSAVILSPVGERLCKGITNIGINPSIPGSDALIKCETYLYDFDEKIYGHEVVINFHEGIRGESKFDDIGQLKHQIERDIEKGRDMWARLELP